MNQTLLNLILALSLNELIHNVLEVDNMRKKLARLTATIDKKAYKELPVNIDTRAKSYSVSLIAFVAFVGPLWLLTTWLSLDQTLILKLSIGLLVASFLATAFTVDKWHVDIEKITRRFKK